MTGRPAPHPPAPPSACFPEAGSFSMASSSSTGLLVVPQTPQPNSATSWLGLPPWLLLEDAYSSFKRFTSVPSPRAFPDPSLHCPSSGLSLHPGRLWDLSRAVMLGFCPGLSSHYPSSWQAPRDPEEGLLGHACHVLRLPPGGSIHLASEATDGGQGGPLWRAQWALLSTRWATWTRPTPPWASVPIYIRERGAGWLLRAPRIIKDGKTGGQAHRLGTQKLPPAPQARPSRWTSPPQARPPSREPCGPRGAGPHEDVGGSPWHVRSSVSSLYPFRQPHSKLPTVLRQKWSQPPLLTRHSLMSAEPSGRRRRREWAGPRCPGRLRSPG